MRRADENRGDWKEWRRRRAWELALKGWSQKKIAEALGVSEGAVSQWMKAEREQGEEGLRGKIAEGPASRLSEAQLGSFPHCSIREQRLMGLPEKCGRPIGWQH
jgi:transposase